MKNWGMSQIKGKDGHGKGQNTRVSLFINLFCFSMQKKTKWSLHIDEVMKSKSKFKLKYLN